MQAYMGYKFGVMEDSPVRIARKRRKLTLQDLADTLGISAGQMSRIERYGTTHFPHALKLAETLRVPLKSLAPRDDEAA